MKNIFLITLLTLFSVCALHTPPVMAQTLLGDDMETVDDEDISRANRFFRECVAKPLFNVSEETTYENCACASAQVEIWEANNKTTTNKVGDFLTPAPEATEMTEDVLKFEIYAPCLHIPAREMLYDECAADRYNKYASQGDPKKLNFLCTCISNGIADYYEIAAQAHLQLRHSEGNEIYDPYEDVKITSEYVQHQRTVRSRCFGSYYEALQNAK